MEVCALRWHLHRDHPVALGAPVPPGPRSALEAVLAEVVEELWRASLPPWSDPGWSGIVVRRAVGDLLRLATGPQLLAGLASIGTGACPIDHEPAYPRGPRPGAGAVPCGCQLVLAAAWAALEGYVAVGSARATVAAAGAEHTVVDGIADPAREELAVAVRATPGGAAGRIGRARELVALPDVADAVAQGVLPAGAGAAVARMLSRLDPQDARHVAQATASRARTRLAAGRPMHTAGVAAFARRRATTTPSWTRARARAVAARRVELDDHGDGTATLSCTLASADALRIHRRLTLWARTLAPDGRGIDAVRADLLRDVLLGEAVSRSSGVEVQVVMTMEALVGLSEEPAHVPGYGPLPADTARDLAADAKWRAWLVDAGTVRNVGTTRYRPSAALARLVRAQQPECAFPGCRHSADRCDLDHRQPFPDGPTTVGNLQPLCRRHHRMKTHAGWEPAPDGTWRTPAGAQASHFGERFPELLRECAGC
jgi:hypothetical protein